MSGLKTHCQYCSRPYGTGGEFGHTHCPARLPSQDAIFREAKAAREGYLKALGDVEKVLRSAPRMIGVPFLRDLEQLKSRAGKEGEK